jgi:hypothetical protein
MKECKQNSQVNFGMKADRTDIFLMENDAVLSLYVECILVLTENWVHPHMLYP